MLWDSHGGSVLQNLLGNTNFLPTFLPPGCQKSPREAIKKCLITGIAQKGGGVNPCLKDFGAFS